MESDLDELEEHVVEAKLQRGWNEWRPDCACGWVGSYWKIRDHARAEGDRHITEATAEIMMKGHRERGEASG